MGLNASIDPSFPQLNHPQHHHHAEHGRRKLTDCAGHFGHIKLALPVFHIGFFKHCQTLLSCICKTCGRVLLPEADRRTFLRAMRSPHADALRKAAIFKKVVDKCKKASFCFECKAVNGKVRTFVRACAAGRWCGACLHP